MIERIEPQYIYGTIIKEVKFFQSIPYDEDTKLVCILFLDDKSHPYLLLSQVKQTDIEVIKDSIAGGPLLTTIAENISFQAKFTSLYKRGVVFEIFDLDYEPPKDMTKKEIEKELGYPINIVSDAHGED